MDKQFILRRLHSLTGIIPVGFFLIYHLYTQLYLHKGPEIYNDNVNSFYESPLAIWILILIVYLPLFFHSILGAFITFEANIQPSYQYFSHLLYWLQRFSGIGVLLFIFAHVWNTKLGPLFANTWGTHWEHLNEGFSDPESGLITKTVYLLGVLGATFHFANGINTFSITWGIALTPRSQNRVRILSIGVFLLLTLGTFYGMSAI